MSRPTHPRLWIAPALLFGLLATSAFSPAAAAQSASSGSSNQHIRSLAVYEYLGSYQKPTRSRLVPVAIWDGTQFQPGSLYLADPLPLSVESGTLYELMKDGNGIGQVEVLRAEQIAAGSLSSTWIGLGKYLPNPPSGPVKLNLPASLTAKSKFASDKPHFAYKPPAATGVAGAKTEPANAGPVNGGAGAEAGRPTLHQPPAGASGPATASGTTPAEEGRPVLHASGNANSAPTLHHRSASQQLNSRQASSYPNRPHLSYSKGPGPVEKLKQDALTGLPPQMHQMAAISDGDGTTDHSYAWQWPTTGDKIAALHKLEALALQLLTPRKPPAPAAAAKSARTTSRTTAKHQAHASHARRAKAPAKSAPAPPLTLTDERFHAFELDWGSGPVYVFSARTSVPGQTTTYITLIAKPDFAGGLIPLYQSITPANLLDYQPRMRLIDAVDATGSGRADLLFDLISTSSRHFALFSVQGGQAQEVFHTGQQ